MGLHFGCIRQCFCGHIISPPVDSVMNDETKLDAEFSYLQMTPFAVVGVLQEEATHLQYQHIHELA